MKETKIQEKSMPFGFIKGASVPRGSPRCSSVLLGFHHYGQAIHEHSMTAVHNSHLPLPFTTPLQFSQASAASGALHK